MGNLGLGKLKFYMLISGTVFAGLVFPFFFSVALSGTEDSVLAVSCLVENSSGILISLATGGFR